MIDFLPQAFMQDYFYKYPCKATVLPGMWTVQLLHHSGYVHVPLMIKYANKYLQYTKMAQICTNHCAMDFFANKVHTHTHTHICTLVYMYTGMYLYHVELGYLVLLKCERQWNVILFDQHHFSPYICKMNNLKKRFISIHTFGGRSICTAGRSF